jgi:Flp pilus assembly protein TadB
MAGGLAGMFLPLVFAAVLAVGGVTVPAGWVAVLAVGLGIGGFVWPDLGLAERIERRRRDFRHSLSAYLDLVTIILAGGGGLETALQTSADLGEGWAFTEIRNALSRARLTNRTPWEVFDDLGTELGVDELRELAASAHLAGDQGARIRASLAAKADSMRAAQTAAIEAQAEAATEKMLLPVVTLVVGMILFIGFGVVQAISTPGTVP